MPNDTEYCYVGLHSCGGWQVVTVDSLDRKKEVAKTVAKIIRYGLTLERWTVDKFRAESKICECLDKKGRQKKLI